MWADLTDTVESFALRVRDRRWDPAKVFRYSIFLGEQQLVECRPLGEQGVLPDTVLTVKEDKVRQCARGLC